MLLNEYLETNDLMGSIQAINPYPFINSNSNVSLAFTFGDRTMSNNVLNLDVNILAELIIERFGDKWDSIVGFSIDDYKLGSDSVSVNETETNSNLNHVIDTDTVNKVSGFNTETLITDTGNTNTDTKTETELVTSKNSNYQLSLKSYFDNLKLLDKTNILNTVQTDITNYITIYIY